MCHSFLPKETGRKKPIFSFFKCTKVQGEWYLVADMRVVCQGDRWNRWLPLTVLFCLLYAVGIPATTLFLITRHRAALYNKQPLPEDGLSHQTAVARFGGLVAGFKYEYFYAGALTHPSSCAPLHPCTTAPTPLRVK